ncbi:3-hydroxyacyl-CoA dehydrogenase/enoyl-CoA hydratase family protein [Natribacillus halophilus]|uniref:3-hydroxyacyl-CoA dehydrogenase n=1 Tax=Natribacillus halophilus TaxID=549003 RepID=A0A1G8Q9Z0_9BACI|nr:3-hydroxyacyl-CoA dehydrogenase/enoyl-CoA hydratase family protein [Natribacillus halophilus]SDJ01511.1 3-hydroxyacyl-CoA dehydrogenase [Natribacillus halophilus]
MKKDIQRAAVLGSGVMGSSIAAHLANVGIPVLLLDIVPNELTDEEKAKGLTLEDRAVRNRLAATNKKQLLKQNPAPLASKKNADKIEVGNLEDDIERLSEVDWIIEVVVEKLEIKQQLFAKVEQYREPGTVVTSNTSGISVNAMVEGRGEAFRRHFMGTHFFNPPRYLHLLEVIPTESTDADVLTNMKTFAEEVLGKGVVEARDTPNFIGNRIGTYGLLVSVQKMKEMGLSITEVDSITGTLIGRPKSATFRTLDVVGLDTFLHVARNVYDQVEGKEQDIFDPPQFLKDMADKGWIGEKAGQGFYLKKGKGENKEILELNPETMEYQQGEKLKSPSVQAAGQAKGKAAKIEALAYADDKAGQFIWETLKATLLYSAEKSEVIANDILAIDNAMKWGFGWDLGPFEVWDALGVERSVKRMEEEGERVPAWVKDMLEAGYKSFYTDAGEFYHQHSYQKPDINEKDIDVPSLLQKDNVITQNSGAVLSDLGDGVAALTFTSPNNAIGLDVIQMINKAIDEVEANYKGLVIANQGKNFCVGANLMMMLMEAQDDAFDELDMVIRRFQGMTARIRYSAKPVVTAPFQMTLGGGAEICLPSASIQASAETYMGLVETGVGLVPGGGGNKELYMREIEKLPEGANLDLQPIANAVFEKIAMATVGTSAQESAENGFMSERDDIIANHKHTVWHAKQKVRDLHEKGYQPPVRKPIPVVGETGYATMLMGAKSMHMGGQISDHDLKIAGKIAFLLAGGRVPKGTEVDENYLLDLEREAFLSLIAEPKSQARMQHMLKTGKPLRN